MIKGKVKFFNSEKGFGFISPESGESDLFVHISEVQGGNALQEGEPVMFEVGQGKKGPCATKVKSAV